MKITQLGGSDMWLTPIGFGAWAIGGGDWQYSWGPQDDNDSIAALHKAIELGINWIDTAPIYGLGHSEELVGRFIRESDVKPFIFTKCGMIWDDKQEITRSLRHIRHECEQSLRRLGIGAIDLYQIHWPTDDIPVEEAWAIMAALKKEGKVRHIGVSNFSAEQLERCLSVAPITSLQPPYSMLNRSIEPEILPWCLEHLVGVINYSPMHSGLLSGAMTRERIASLPPDDFRPRTKNFQEPLLSRNLRVADLLGQIGQRHGVSAGVVAIAWTLCNPAISAAIVGARNPKQVEGVWPASNFRLSNGEFEEINRFLADHP